MTWHWASQGQWKICSSEEMRSLILLLLNYWKEHGLSSPGVPSRLCWLDFPNMREDDVQMTAPSCKDTSETSYLPNGMRSGFSTYEEILLAIIAAYGCLILTEQSSPTVFKLQNQPNRKATSQNYSKRKSLTFPKHSGWLASLL